MSIAQRSIRSVSWLGLASISSIVVGVVRSILLARWLPVHIFGTYALATAVVSLTVVIPNFGLVGAFLHRSPETEDMNIAAAVHFTLELIFIIIWAVLLSSGVLIYGHGQTGVAILLLTFTTAGIQLTQTPRAILIRRVVQRRLALIQIINAILTTIAALYLASIGITLWALLATDIISLFVLISGLYVWRPVWRPRFLWVPHVVRYFLRFGSRNFASIFLLQILNQIDKLWIGIYLGETPLGLYSKATRFAIYPNIVLSSSITSVVAGTYAELKEKQKELSQAFFRTNALLVRSGLFLSGIFILIAPEFIHLALGEKWMPMLNAFRLMLIFALLDPIKLTVANLFVAVGKPEHTLWARFIQLIVMLLGISLLGPGLGITGVALSMNIMLAVGIFILLWQARTYVSFSAIRLFASPGIAFLMGILLANAANHLPGIIGSYWLICFAKSIIFISVYGTILFISERRQIFETVRFLGNSLFNQSK